jgi:glycosyltransferase involved in cell wall biosynthesis
MQPKRQAKVSVIIPTYQEGRYIGNLLSTLLEIDNELETIVVDGGSTDETVKVSKKLANKVYVANQRGISKARNYGAYQSFGEILVFLDADVYPPRDFVEKTLRTFEDARIVGATCNIMPMNPHPGELAFFRFYNLLLRLYAAFKPHSRGEFFAVRKSVFMTVGGFDESLPCLEDHDLALRISKLGKFAFISDLSVHESMRRIRKLGLLNVVRTWIVNYISYALTKRTISEVWVPVR